MSGFIGRMFGGSSRTVQTPTISSKTAPTAALKKPEVKKTSKTATSVLPAPSAHHHSSVPTGSSSPITASLASPRISSFSLPSTFQIPGPIEQIHISDASMDMLVQMTVNPEGWDHDAAMAIAEILVDEGYIQVESNENTNMKNRIYHFMMLPGMQKLITYLWVSDEEEVIAFNESSLSLLFDFIQENQATISTCDFGYENSLKYMKYDSLDEYKLFLSRLDAISLVGQAS